MARIGEGGMGTVYLSYTRGGQPVALKVIRREYGQDPDFRRRFEQEVQAARRVQGYHIVPVVDHDTGGELPWLASTFIPGMPLQDALAMSGPLPLTSVFQLVGCAARALTAIHAVGVVHRDLKPSNILLGPAGPYVIDFGIARAADATQLTQSGGLVGTPQYMSPEHALGEQVGPATDVFSLGLIAAVAATGRHPYGDGGAITVAAQIANSAHRPPDLSGYPDQLRALLERCLAPNPAERIGTEELTARCQELAGRPLNDLGEWLPEPLRAEIARREQSLQSPPPPADPQRPATPPQPAAMPPAPGTAPPVPGSAPQVAGAAPGASVPPMPGGAPATPPRTAPAPSAPGPAAPAAHPTAAPGPAHPGTPPDAPGTPAYGYPATGSPAYGYPATPAGSGGPGYGYPQAAAPGPALGGDATRQFGAPEGQGVVGALGQAGVPGGTGPSAQVGGAPANGRPRRRWRMALLAAALVVAVGAGAGTAVWWIGRDKDTTDSQAGHDGKGGPKKSPSHSSTPAGQGGDETGSESPGSDLSSPPPGATYTVVFPGKKLTLRPPGDEYATVDVDLDEPKVDAKGAMDDETTDFQVSEFDDAWQFSTTFGKSSGDTPQECAAGASTDVLPSQVSFSEIGRKDSMINEGDRLCTITQKGNLAMFVIDSITPSEYDSDAPTVEGKVTLWSIDY
ncbi:serine/threonine-protein kinase [Streptomyces odontomachi]|uniref:serine/threonine-protein kinase n=1 Tax=Streptomyces odontomachi TaxID=2944940 RepID=UPI00210AFD8D|nr:serine/threonine-protein kinase [Streptomyces sp. ODS25]